ncbi:hypothetical protein HELRODRAFT_170078 [Helobdella robusta]|uniref:Uncharacterized protein n=1 Tax=Helobdella robusta TaxID=6412 RepID=T1F2L9_HELRO|nr:hypothetical protein HELRODRAFT_170078 [Helobdella robusta]ESO07539.1 hypothetical protein HELRODRAFT_170078 [Helobdella robusta]
MTLDLKRFSKDSHDIQVINALSEAPNLNDSQNARAIESPNLMAVSKKNIVTLEAPSSTSVTANNVNINAVNDGNDLQINSFDPNNLNGEAQPIDEIVNGFRTCLRYFLPPNWHMDKETVSSLDNIQLSRFPLEDFFDQYEKGLKKLISSFQQDAQQSSHRLSFVRKMVAKLLKTINEDFEIDPECDSEEVDNLLELCLQQALAHARSSNNAA